MNFANNTEPQQQDPASPEPVEVPPPPSPESEMSGSTENSRDPPFVETVHYARQNRVSTVMLQGIPIVSLVMDGVERLCLAQISNTLLKAFSYNEIHNRRVALGITCVQCTPVQLEILRRAGAMPISSRRCGMITKREAERLVRSFLGDTTPPKLPENFAFEVKHSCGWGCTGKFAPSRYNSSRAKCIKCNFCNIFFSPNKFIFHFHRTPNAKYHHPDAANFNSWRRHLHLDITPTTTKELSYAWEDVKAMFNGGSRKRLVSTPRSSSHHDVEEKRPRMDDRDNNMPKLSGISYPYPVLPLAAANNSVAAAAAAAAAAACTMPGYVSRPPHPAFPFPMPDDSFQPHESQTKVQEQQNSFADLWKTKGSPYCNPFGFFWAKNFGMYNDPSVQYRNVIDLSRSSQQKHAPSTNAIEAKAPEDGPISPLPLNMTWPGFGASKLPLDRKSAAAPEAPNYFSAFKPVSRDSNQPFDRRPSTISPVSDEKWPARPQSIDSCNSQFLDNDLASSEIDPDDENINVTDVDASDIPRSPLSSPGGSKDDVRVPAPLKSSTPEWQESEDMTQKNGQQEMCEKEAGQKTPECHDSNIEKRVNKDEEIVTDPTNNNELESFCHMNKEDLQLELCKLLDERSKAEQEYQTILDAMSDTKKNEDSEKNDVSEHMQLFQDCLNNTNSREKKEKTALFSKLQEAREALMQFSTKMVALRSCIHT